jgi:hypothetical protein
MTKTEVTIITGLVIALVWSAVTLAQAKIELTAWIENRGQDITTIEVKPSKTSADFTGLEVKPTRHYEDNLQKTFNNKLIKVQYSPNSVQLAPYGE